MRAEPPFIKSNGNLAKLKALAKGTDISVFLRNLSNTCHFVEAEPRGESLVMKKVVPLNTADGREKARQNPKALADMLKNAVARIADMGLMYLDFKPHNMGYTIKNDNIQFVLLDHDALQDITGDLDQDNTAQTPLVFFTSLHLNTINDRKPLYELFMKHNIAVAYWATLSDTFFEEQLAFVQYAPGVPKHFCKNNAIFSNRHLTKMCRLFRERAKEYVGNDMKFSLMADTYDNATKGVVAFLKTHNVKIEGTFTDHAR